MKLFRSRASERPPSWPPTTFPSVKTDLCWNDEEGVRSSFVLTCDDCKDVIYGLVETLVTAHPFGPYTAWLTECCGAYASYRTFCVRPWGKDEGEYHKQVAEEKHKRETAATEEASAQ